MKKEKIILYIIVPICLLVIFSAMLADQYLQHSNFADSQRSGAEETLSLTGSININTANAEELDSLPGIGPVIAKRIIEYREINGPFQSLYDLYAVEGIGPSTINKLIHLIRMEDSK